MGRAKIFSPRTVGWQRSWPSSRSRSPYRKCRMLEISHLAGGASQKGLGQEVRDVQEPNDRGIKHGDLVGEFTVIDLGETTSWPRFAISSGLTSAARWKIDPK